MATIITYDLANKHTEVKEAMYGLGYSYRFAHEGKWIVLPNTTLYHATKTPATARDELRAICSRMGATLERAFATEMHNWASYA